MIDMPPMTAFVYGKFKNAVGKRQNAGLQHFLLFPQCFQKHTYATVIKSWHSVVKDWC